MSRGRRSPRRGARRVEPLDPQAPIKGQLALFGDDPGPDTADPAAEVKAQPDQKK